MNFQNEDFKEEKWYYNSIILNKGPWQRHVTTIDSEIFFDRRLLRIIDNHDKSNNCIIIESSSSY